MTTAQKISLFMSLFKGLPTAYGTYETDTGKHWQIKTSVTRHVIYHHLKGIQPYGFYPLTGGRTSVGVADFDHDDPERALDFIKRARHYNMDAYVERSKEKGYHAWMFFDQKGVPARKVRLVIQHILEEIGAPDTEVFPKQDSIGGNDCFGNFINAPLFGKRVPEGRTVFLQPDLPLKPFPNQWVVLRGVKKISEDVLDNIIEINELADTAHSGDNHDSAANKNEIPGYGLPACIRTLLENGVSFDQRVACFRIAVHLKRVGLPHDAVVALLMSWRLKNQPKPPKQILRLEEVREQVGWAFKKDYRGYGCQESVIKTFCDSECPILKITTEYSN
jgi:hypothetical protein